MFWASRSVLGWEIFVLASLFQAGARFYTSRYPMKHSCDTNKWQMQFQIKVLPSHFEGGNDKLRLVRRFDAGACFSKFKNTGRVLENKLDVLSGWHSPGREGLLFLLHDPVSLCLLNKKLGKLQEKKSWFKTSRHTCFVLTSPCHGRTNCFNQFQSALEPKGKKKRHLNKNAKSAEKGWKWEGWEGKN